MIKIEDYDFKLLNIIKDAEKELSEREIRERYKRKSSLVVKLKVLLDKKLITRSKVGRVFFYKSKEAKSILPAKYIRMRLRDAKKEDPYYPNLGLGPIERGTGPEDRL